MDNHPIQCFYAVKEGAGGKQVAVKGAAAAAGTALAEEKKEDPTAEEAEEGESANNLAQLGGPRNTIKRNHFTDHVPTDETDLEIAAINAAKGSWTANTCML